jgi:uncharacterized protein YciI
MPHPARFFLLAGALLLLAPAASAQDLPLPAEWSTHYAWFLVADPGYRASSRAADSVVTHDHIQYQLRLQAEGRAIASGGFAPLEGDAVIGMTILRAGSREEAVRIAEADPAVVAGRLVARVREWWVPTERLP